MPSAPQIAIVLLVLAIVIVIFGSKNIKNLGSDLGGFIKGFRNAVKDDSKINKEETNTSTEQKTTESPS